MKPLQEDRNRKSQKSAYHLWVLAGRPGQESEMRHAAGREAVRETAQVLNDDLDMAGKDSFPASDPVNHT